MRTTVSFALLMGSIALLAPLAIPAAHAQTVEGTFDYNYEAVYHEEAHGKTILYALEHEWWTGTFDGTAHALFIVIVNEAGGMTVDLLSTFTGTVHGKMGSLVIRLIGEKPSPEDDWGGDWEIIRGTGELVNLRGQGTWGGPGYEGPDPPDPNWDPVGAGNTRPDIWYTGTITEHEAFRAAVEEIFATYASTLNADNPDLWMSLWDENGVQMPPDHPAISGKQAIEESNGKDFQTTDYEEFTINVEETQVAGDWGFARGTYSGSFTPKAGGETVLIDGKYLTIFRRQADGSWKIFRDCFNFNGPPK